MTISQLRYVPGFRGYQFTLHLLDDFEMTEAYKFFKWLLGKETRQDIKDLASVEVPDQQSFAQKVFSVTGGRVSHIRNFVSDMGLCKALPTGLHRFPIRLARTFEHTPLLTSHLRCSDEFSCYPLMDQTLLTPDVEGRSQATATAPRLLCSPPAPAVLCPFMILLLRLAVKLRTT